MPGPVELGPDGALVLEEPADVGALVPVADPPLKPLERLLIVIADRDGALERLDHHVGVDVEPARDEGGVVLVDVGVEGDPLGEVGIRGRPQEARGRAGQAALPSGSSAEPAARMSSAWTMGRPSCASRMTRIPLPSV